MTSNNLVIKLTKDEKLYGNNYDIWHREIQYLLNEKKVSKTLINSMTQPKKGITIKH